MKALKCLGCKTIVIVNDNAVGYCEKCHLPLQDDKYRTMELSLKKDTNIRNKKPSKKIIKNNKIKTKKKHKNDKRNIRPRV